MSRAVINHESRTLNPLALPLHGSTLIEASAGTGKTFTIAILYVRLVLGHGQPDGTLLGQGIDPPNLLVVTFTEAATKELRDRIRARLTQAAEVFSESADDTNPPPETALIYQLRNESYPDPATWPACRKRLLLAAEWMDEAAVSTIHSWCHRMLSEHAFDSGSLFRLTLETDQTELLDEVVRDYWRTFAYPLSPDLMEEVLDHWKTPGDLRKSVRKLLSDSNRSATPDMGIQAAIEYAVDARHERSSELKARPWPQWRDEVIDLLNGLAKRLHGSSRKSMVTAWDNLLAWAESDDLLPEGLDKAGLQNQTPEGLEEKIKGDGPLPSHPAFDAIAELMAFSADLPGARANILRHASQWVSERLESEKQKRSEMGFDDLLTRLDQALQGPRGPQLAATIRRQFPAALIDEFQDTDPVQYRIFDRIYRVADNDPATCLLMIGDPKQAIYGFRGADIHTYLEARRGVRDRTFTLGRNFRSSQAMVNAVNRVFAYGDQCARDGAFLFGKGDTTPLPFQPVDANGTRQAWSVNGEVQPSLRFWTLESHDDRHLAKGSATEAVAETCASEVAHLLTLGQAGQAGFADNDNPADLDPVRPGDIAILVNNRNEAAAVRDALRQRRIRSVYLSDRDSVLTSPAAAEMLCWLRAFAEPRQLALARAALATPTLGLPWRQLDQLLTDEMALEREIERFMGYQQQWQNQGVLPTLRRFLMDFEVPGQLLQRPDGERRLTDILHIAELLQQDSLQLDGEHALVHHYTQILRAADNEDEHRTLRLESDAGLVKVITVHKSKGLEYPLVFLPFGTAFRAEDQKQAFVRYHDDSGELVTVFDPAPDDVSRADRERLGEDIRKLYVALTRARHATWVGAAALNDWQLSSLGYLLDARGEASGELGPRLQTLAEGYPEIVVALLPQAEASHYHEDAPETLGPALISTREPREDWWIASYSSIEYTGLSGTGIPFVDEVEDAEAQNLLEESRQMAEPSTAAPAARNQHHFPKGAGPGTFLHELLEWCTAQGMAALSADPSQLRDQLARRCRTRGWGEWVEPLEHWLLGIFRQPLPLDRDSRQSASLESLTTLRPELEFWFESRNVSTRRLDALVSRHTLNGADRPKVDNQQFNGMVKGFIDLVFEHNGRYYVLDYKSNTLGEDDSAYTRQAMGEAILEKRYDLQYVLYLLALHRLLKARLPDYDYDTHIGGAVYLFLRGIAAPTAGVFADKPPRALIESLDALFDGDAGQGGGGMSQKRDNDQQFALDLDDAAETATPPQPEPVAETAPPVDTTAPFANLDAMEYLLGQWQEHEWIRPLDREFARLIRTLSEEQGEQPAPLLILLAALVSHQVGRGHVCIDLGLLLGDTAQTLSLPPEAPGWSGTEAPPAELPRPDQLLAQVSLDDCRQVLANAGAASQGDRATPLVLDDTRLYLRRFWRYEQRIADGIRQRLEQPTRLEEADSTEGQTLRSALDTLFRSHDEVDYQKLACALAARHRFAVITGGPGTGKTTTVVNLLAAMQSVAGTSPERQGRKYRIRLAAPTGKAAARLNESIGGAVSRLPLAKLPGHVSQDDIPTRVTTLHRLLGSRPDSRQFRHNRDNPLLVDILVIDEASMVDVDLMASVIDALPASAHLVLLGDRDQLASVDAGAVLGELCQRAGRAHYTDATVDWLAAITGSQVPESLRDNRGRDMDQAVAMLRKSYRFREDSGIRKLADAVNNNALGDDILATAKHGDFEDVAILSAGPSPEDTQQLICQHAVTGSPAAFHHQGEGRSVNGLALSPPAGYRRYLTRLADHRLNATSPREEWDNLARQVLADFGDFQILCALRKGPWGVEGLNDLIARQLLSEKLIPRAEGWYAGRPVLVTGNDYNLGLMNGDIGITFSLPWDQDENGEPRQTLRVAFPASDGTDDIRWISPSRLQQLETVYAMTVHKSQGSEFTHTCLILPDRLSPVLTRELVYTGITRARHWFSLIGGDEAVLKESVAQRVVRASGLAERLWH